jgi:peroxin-11B
VKNQFGLTRKIMRVGKFVEHIRAGSELYDATMKSNNGDKVTQYLQILRQVGYGGYMFFDMMTLLDAMGVKKNPRAKNVQQTAYRFWLTGLAASALAGIYSKYRLRERTQAVDEKDAEAKVEKVKLARYVAWTSLRSHPCMLTLVQTTKGCQHPVDFRSLRLDGA